jgi:hypothetical protein
MINKDADKLGKWDFITPDWNPPEPKCETYSLGIFKWIASGNGKRCVKSAAVFRCSAYVGDEAAITAAKMYCEALNLGAEPMLLFKGRKSTFFDRRVVPDIQPINFYLRAKSNA